jgi:hypothetical protein
MSVELIFGLIFVVLIVAILFFNRSSKGLDVNQDGKVDVEDAKVAVQNTVEGVKKEVAKRTSNRSRKGPGQTSAKAPAKKPAVKAKTNRTTRKV